MIGDNMIAGQGETEIVCIISWFVRIRSLSVVEPMITARYCLYTRVHSVYLGHHADRMGSICGMDIQVFDSSYVRVPPRRSPASTVIARDSSRSEYLT